MFIIKNSPHNNYIPYHNDDVYLDEELDEEITAAAELLALGLTASPVKNAGEELLETGASPVKNVGLLFPVLFFVFFWKNLNPSELLKKLKRRKELTTIFLIRKLFIFFSTIKNYFF